MTIVLDPTWDCYRKRVDSIGNEIDSKHEHICDTSLSLYLNNLEILQLTSRQRYYKYLYHRFSKLINPFIYDLDAPLMGEGNEFSVETSLEEEYSLIDTYIIHMDLRHNLLVYKQQISSVDFIINTQPTYVPQFQSFGFASVELELVPDYTFWTIEIVRSTQFKHYLYDNGETQLLLESDTSTNTETYYLALSPYNSKLFAQNVPEQYYSWQPFDEALTTGDGWYYVYPEYLRQQASDTTLDWLIGALVDTLAASSNTSSTSNTRIAVNYIQEPRGSLAIDRQGNKFYSINLGDIAYNYLTNGNLNTIMKDKDGSVPACFYPIAPA